MISSSFLFTLCQAGAEAALKRELARTHPEFKFSYSRPGFLTFKSGDQPLSSDFRLDSVFARAYGLSLGKLDTLDRLHSLSDELDLGNSVCLHVFERSQHLPGDEPPNHEAGKWTETFLTQLRVLPRNERFRINAIPEPGETVLNVIRVDEHESWVGVHSHLPPHSPYPGGTPLIDRHPKAPSRAYLKMEDALLWSQAPIKKDDLVLEIGSAPGGASFSLLMRGLRVIGIDPGEMDPWIRMSDRFIHIQAPVAQVRRDDLPDGIRWIVLDMNVQPSISLYAVDRFATSTRKSLYGLILTVKLNQWKLADEIPLYLEHVRSMGMMEVRATQLSQNRQEICIYALTQLGRSQSRK